MSLIKNLINQVKSNERYNYVCYMNDIRNSELEDFFKECKENNQRAYPTWSSVKLLYTKKKYNINENNVQTPQQETPIIVIDDDDSSISSRTRSKINSVQVSSNSTFSQSTIDNYLFNNNNNNNNNNNSNSNLNLINLDVLLSSNNNIYNDMNINNVNGEFSSRTQSNRGSRSNGTRGNSYFRFFRNRGRGRARGRGRGRTKAKS